MKRIPRFGVFLFIAAAVLFCLGTMLVRSPQVRAQNDNNQGNQDQHFRVTSTTLTNNSFIPASMVFNQYPCTGGNTSPQLSWTQGSGDVNSYAVVMYDVTANFTHWGVYNIPPYITDLPENAGGAGSQFTNQVTNDFGSFGFNPGYDGPCPPPAGTFGPPVHTYVITVYALDTRLQLNSPTDPYFPPNGSALFRAMIGHLLESADITGFFKCPSMGACQ